MATGRPKSAISHFIRTKNHFSSKEMRVFSEEKFTRLRRKKRTHTFVSANTYVHIKRDERSCASTAPYLLSKQPKSTGFYHFFGRFSSPIPNQSKILFYFPNKGHIENKKENNHKKTT